MGMSASQSRLLALTARLSDIELEAQVMQNAKINNSMKDSAERTNYLNALSSGDENAIASTSAIYDAAQSRIQVVDKAYDMSLAQLNTEHTAVQTEVDSVKKVIDKNIERSFKIFDA